MNKATDKDSVAALNAEKEWQEDGDDEEGGCYVVDLISIVGWLYEFED